ncbi:flavodoxin [Serpentinicella sp. ANB-PHB4]|uniref:flavodoxin family protein n=1 Tax=Serpentinicella sp. ANB-PHB4 TaxID=3074076 RepID=UPI002858D6E3|nr:flavodoxin [Serpentinicella sp. ANB-PHB4]MDR5659031.1 flavodoxin [Serpentinicella sp. ANB-PHB4]
MKALVIYYSYDGNTKLIAESIAESINGDVIQLKPKKEGTAKKKITKYLWGGSQVLMNKTPELLPLNLDINEYDIIFIGSPVWAWTFAPPIRTFFNNYVIKNKHIALFSCHGGQLGKTFVNMKKQLSENNFVGEIDVFEPLKKDTKISTDRVKNWAEEIMNNVKK